MRDAESDDARLACARARENQNRTGDGFDGEALLRIERGQIRHGARKINCPRANASEVAKFFISTTDEHGLTRMGSDYNCNQ